MKEKILIAFSGGRTSAMMTRWLLLNKSDKFDFVVVFANTGKEREETLKFVDLCDKTYGFNVRWVEAVISPKMGVGTKHKIVDYKIASRNGEPFKAMIAKYGIPNIAMPICSRELKTNAIIAYARSIGWKKKDYRTAIGIRGDEPSRLDWEKAKKERLCYPLANEIFTTKSDVNKFWRSQPFDLQLKSYEGNCDLCFKKSWRKLMTISLDNPDLTIWWKDMECEFEMFVPESRIETQMQKPPIRFFREKTTVDELIEMSRFPFDRAIDESKYIQHTIWDNHLDSNGGCVESCEAF